MDFGKIKQKAPRVPSVYFGHAKGEPSNANTAMAGLINRVRAVCGKNYPRPPFIPATPDNAQGCLVCGAPVPAVVAFFLVLLGHNGNRNSVCWRQNIGR